MRRVVLGLVVAFGSASCLPKKPNNSSSVNAAAQGILLAKAVVRVVPDSAAYFSLNPDITIAKNTDYALTVKNRTTEDRRFFTVTVSAYPNGAIDLNNYTPPVGAFTVAVGGLEQQAYFANASFSLAYCGFIKKGENMEIKISKIPPEFALGTLYLSGQGYPQQSNLVNTSGFSLDSSKSIESDIDLTAMANAANKEMGGGFREGERIKFNINIRKVDVGFQVVSEEQEFDLTGNSSTPPISGTVPQLRAKYLVDGMNAIEISPMILANDTGFDSQGNVIKQDNFLTVHLAYAKNMRRTLIHLSAPAGQPGIISGDTSLYPMDNALTAGDSGDKIKRYPLPPLSSSDREDTNNINHFSSFADGYGGLSIDFPDDGTTLNGYVDLQSYTPIIEGAPLPAGSREEKISDQITVDGKILRRSTPDTEGSSFDLGPKNLEPGLIEYRYSSSAIPQRSDLYVTGTISRKNVIVADLETGPSGQLASFNSVPDAFEKIFSPGLYHFDAGPKEEFPNWAGLLSPGAYKSELAASNDPTALYTNTNFPAREILEAMEEIRSTWHETIPRARHKMRTIKNWVDLGAVDGCLGNTAEHWSDITLHYYCQYGNARMCYTDTIRTQAEAIGNEMALIPPDQKPAKMPEIFAKLAGVRTGAFATCRDKALTAKREADASGTPLDPQSTEAEWLWILGLDAGEPLPTTLTISNREKMFHFIMEAPTFAFPYEMQQRVLNTYYRVQSNNRTVDATVDSSSITAESCNAVRMGRGIEMIDQATYLPMGTQCSAAKILKIGQKAVHR